MKKDQTGCSAGRTRASVLAGRTGSRASERALRLHLRVSTQPQRRGSQEARVMHWGVSLPMQIWVTGAWEKGRKPTRGSPASGGAQLCPHPGAKTTVTRTERNRPWW